MRRPSRSGARLSGVIAIVDLFLLSGFVGRFILFAGQGSDNMTRPASRPPIRAITLRRDPGTVGSHFRNLTLVRPTHRVGFKFYRIDDGDRVPALIRDMQRTNP